MPSGPVPRRERARARVLLRRAAGGALAAVFAIESAAALAQQPPAAPKPSEGAGAEEGGGDDADPAAAARMHFDRGLALYDEKVWDAALAEFLRSLELHPTRAAMKNAGLCLRKLNRFDEALEMFERLAAIPDLEAADRSLALRMIADLSALVGTIAVESAEPGATFTIDGRIRGETPARAPLRVPVGSHVVRVHKQGFEAFEARVEVAGGQSVRIRAILTPIGPAPQTGAVAFAPPKPPVPGDEGQAGAAPRARNNEARREGLFLEARGALSYAPSFGGDIPASCTDACSSGPGLGFVIAGRGGYSFAAGSGFDIDLALDVGYLLARADVRDRATVVMPVGLEPNHGSVDDALSLRAVALGASAGLSIGARVRGHFRLGGGALLGSLTDDRSGTFLSAARLGKPSEAYSIAQSQSPSSPSVYVAPEARFGVRVGEHLELLIGLEALVSIALTEPVWEPEEGRVLTAGDGLGELPRESLRSKVMVIIAPGAGLRYAF